MSNDLDRLALEAKADRLSGVFLRVKMLAQARGLDFETAGREAVATGLITAWDWQVIREAVGGR